MRVSIPILLFGLMAATSSAQDVILQFPDSLSGEQGGSVSVPVLISGQLGKSILSAEMAIGFRESVLTATDTWRLGNAVPASWMCATNPFSCSLLVAMAGYDTLIAGDTLVVLRMRVDAADTSSIWLIWSRLNEGNVPCTTIAGKFHGYPGGLEETSCLRVSLPVVHVLPSPAVRATAVLLASHLSGSAQLDILDVRGVLVRGLFAGRVPAEGLSLRWDCRDCAGRVVPPGIYFCRMQAGDYQATRKLLLVD